jgi:4-aminobutyrate aminotransferase
MIGVEFVEDKRSKKPAHELQERIVNLAFERGLLMLGCGRSTIRISPPLSVSRAEIDEGLAIFEQAITVAEQEVF